MISSRPQVGEQSERVTVSQATMQASESQGVHLSMEFNFRTVPFKLDFTGGTIDELIAASKPWPIEASLHADGLSLEGKGRVLGPSTTKDFDVSVELSGEHLHALNSLIEADLPALGPFSLAGTFSGSAKELTVSNMTGRIGGSDLLGNLDLSIMPDGIRLGGVLKAENIQLQDFLETGHDVQRLEAEAPLQDFSIPVQAMKSMTVDLDMTVQHMFMGPSELGSLTISTSLGDGRLEMKPALGNVFGGTLEGTLVLDVREDVPSASIQATAQTFNYGEMLNQLKVTEQVEGFADMSLRYMGRGSTLFALLERPTLQFSLVPSKMSAEDDVLREYLPVTIGGVEVRVSDGGTIQVGAKGMLQGDPFTVSLDLGTLSVSLAVRSVAALMSSGVSSAVTSGPSSLATGGAFTAVTVILTVAVSVAPLPSETV